MYIKTIFRKFFAKTQKTLLNIKKDGKNILITRKGWGGGVLGQVKGSGLLVKKQLMGILAVTGYGNII